MYPVNIIVTAVAVTTISTTAAAADFHHGLYNIVFLVLR